MINDLQMSKYNFYLRVMSKEGFLDLKLREY